MDKTNIGSWIRTQSYKHDGSLHRTWDNMMIIDANEDYIVTGSCASRVVECDGRIWYTKEPAVSIYFKHNWFNVIAMVRGDNICYYCNIASPTIEDGHTLEYIDYDLDLKLFPDKSILELDKKEYLYHKEKYNYSNDLDKVIIHEFNRVKKLMKQNVFPFIDKKIFDYINVYYKIKKEQDEIY